MLVYKNWIMLFVSFNEHGELVEVCYSRRSILHYVFFDFPFTLIFLFRGCFFEENWIYECRHLLWQQRTTTYERLSSFQGWLSWVQSWRCNVPNQKEIWSISSFSDMMHSFCLWPFNLRKPTVNFKNNWIISSGQTMLLCW
jgi:hypothetical protein